MNRLYIVTRSDLSPGLQVAQSCHAMRQFAHAYPELDGAWFRDSNNLVCLSVANEDELHAIVDKAAAEGCPVVCFNEPDLANALTAIALGEDAKRFVRNLGLALAA